MITVIRSCCDEGVASPSLCRAGTFGYGAQGCPYGPSGCAQQCLAGIIWQFYIIDYIYNSIIKQFFFYYYILYRTDLKSVTVWKTFVAEIIFIISRNVLFKMMLNIVINVVWGNIYWQDSFVLARELQTCMSFLRDLLSRYTFVLLHCVCLIGVVLCLQHFERLSSRVWISLKYITMICIYHVRFQIHRVLSIYQLLLSSRFNFADSMPCRYLWWCHGSADSRMFRTMQSR